MTDQEAARWAQRFWRLVGRTEPFPRSLESSVAWALPLAVVKLPHLGLSELRSWLSRKGIRLHMDGPDRPLRACLLARAERGLVVLEGSDPEDERRLSLAHEISHFLADYSHPRQKALEALGEAGREVLDGLRLPTLEERLTGILRGVEVGVYTHLMERSAVGEVNRLDVLAAEDRADRIALELLAPRQTVLERLEARKIRWRERSAVTAATEILVEEFGLPVTVAQEYGRSLVLRRRSTRSFREWLGTT
ncbi:MAG: hypothetical protein L0191_18235 [Acidobacteria bacterium]|nr:hypothetical protein [Acidobacteriota bacterium]